MKSKISKIMGVAVTLAMVLSLTAGFAAAPAAASPDETINEWYQFDYPVEGEDGGWFYDPSILADGKITEAIDDTLYVSVVRYMSDATFDDIDGTLTITEFDNSDTGMVTADIDGDWNGPETDFVACFEWNLLGQYDGTACVRGTITATNLSFEGSIESITDPGTASDDDLSDLVLLSPMPISGGSLIVGGGGFTFVGSGSELTITNGHTDIASAIFKSDDGGRSWEETDYPGGWVVDMAASSIDADSLYVTDGHYVYKTDDAGDTWDLVAQDSLEEKLAGDCGIPPCCANCDEGCHPACDRMTMEISCPITSIDVTYDADDNPFVFIGTRTHRTGVDLTPPTGLDCIPGDVYYIGEGGYPANWTSLNLSCFGTGYDVLAVGCAPDWAESRETYAVVSDGSETWVIYTKGTICGWYEFAELECNCLNSFGSVLASRIGFPDDWEDSETLFVGVVDCDACREDPTQDGGDVYLATDGDAIDLNVAGLITGCVGDTPVDIISLDVMGDTDEASLIAGAFCCPEVYYSTDGGWSWDASEKDPTGDMWTNVIFYEDTALATTMGTECAVSMSCGEEVGQYWNQISLIATDIESVLYIDHSPGYVCGDSETMFMLTYRDCPGSCLATVGPYGCVFECPDPDECYDSTQSLFRYDGTNWERVFTNFIAGSDESPYQIQRVRVSPDFNTTNCVYVTNSNFEMWRTTDAGCSWDKLTFPCSPRPCIGAAIVIDEDTVIAGGACHESPCENACGYVYKTTRHGARPWDEYEVEGAGSANFFALEPGYTDPGSVLLGDDLSQVFISEDGGETWDLVGDCADVLDPTDGTYDTWVIFDPGYATNHIIYAAAGHNTARCIIDPDEDWADQEWELLCDDLYDATGIAVTGDTALYVADNDDVDYPTLDDPVDDEHEGVIYEGGVLRSLNPDTEDADDVVFERIGPGLVDGETELRHLWLTCDTSDDGCAENVLWSLEQYDESPENIWVYEDTLAQPVVLNTPVEGQKVGTTGKATLSWKELCGADCYEVSLYSYCPECPDQKLEVPLCLDCAPTDDVACGPEVECTHLGVYATDLFIDGITCCPCTEETCIVVDDLDPGTTYYWQVRVCQGNPTLSKWSEERTFITALPAVDFELLCSPECGGQNVIITPNFSWQPVEEATGYEVELAPTETFTAGVIKGKTTVNAWACTATLDYATTYYWRVRAEKDGIYSDWSTCLFTTMEKPVPPTPPVEVVTPPAQPAPVVQIPAAEMITPTWIYAMIGVGAALAIVVIVLIVRTRRPPA